MVAKVFIHRTTSGDAYNNILRYLHYNLPKELPRKVIDLIHTEPILIIDLDYDKTCTYIFNGEILTFNQITDTNHFKKNDGCFEPYIVLRIYGENLDTIESFIKYVSDYIDHSLFNIEVKNVYNCDEWGRWNKESSLKNRSIDSTYLPKKIKENIIEDISFFLDKKTVDRYHELNITHSRIYMLYGPPGTGKTTLIKALANHFNKNLAYFSVPHEMEDNGLKRAIKYIPKNSFFVLEDIDALFTEREADDNNLSFSGFINILDGIPAPDDSVIFITTNHLESLDNAIVRRIGHFTKFTYATKEQINEMFCNFFPDYASRFDEFYDIVSGSQITINILEKFFVRYLFDDIISKSKLFSQFANSELKIELSNTEKLYT